MEQEAHIHKHTLTYTQNIPSPVVSMIIPSNLCTRLYNFLRVVTKSPYFFFRKEFMYVYQYLIVMWFMEEEEEEEGANNNNNNKN